MLASVLLLTACGSAEDEVITGNDWRVTGSYAWMTFEHGETINALVGMDADKLTVFLCSNHVIPILNKQH